ncbi:PREDICTED: uncharacterized protein LOC109221375 [Nicotiana attenuata]|uniref:uncharacterized protein LOC109221375 n=1 Tax=Nicotiana attenuata TaxID=49451 RepID=UPI000905C839|nr:PREDICTED: uncharacterized protein LOC109221375 [Nicotiana attenuata]
MGGGTAGVFRNASGAWVYGFTKPLRHTNILQAELLALYHGLQLENAHNFRPLQVETDSQVLLHILSSAPLKHSHIIFACKSMLRDLQVTQIQHTFREGNVVADVLAKHGKTIKNFQHTDVLLFENPTYFALPLLATDVTRIVTFRSVPTPVTH